MGRLLHMELTDSLRKAIDFWSEYHFVAFTDSAAERERLNEIENNSELEMLSTLGEIEVLTDTIMGVARSCL